MKPIVGSGAEKNYNVRLLLLDVAHVETGRHIHTHNTLIDLGRDQSNDEMCIQHTNT